MARIAAAWWAPGLAALLMAAGGHIDRSTAQTAPTAAEIAAVADDTSTLQVALALGARARNVTSRYDGSAVIESIVLGDGEVRHTDTLRALLDAGANPNLPDRDGRTPLALARARGHDALVRLLERAGAR